jgi:hypothetical protein
MEEQIKCDQCISLSICLANIEIKFYDDSMYSMIAKGVYKRCSYFREQLKSKELVTNFKRYFFRKKGKNLTEIDSKLFFIM